MRRKANGCYILIALYLLLNCSILYVIADEDDEVSTTESKSNLSEI